MTAAAAPTNTAAAPPSPHLAERAAVLTPATARRARSAAGGLGGRCWPLRFSAAAAAAGSAVGVVSFVGLPTRRRLGFVAILDVWWGCAWLVFNWCGRVARVARREFGSADC